MFFSGDKPNSVSLPDGATGHWIGDPDAANVLVWYHGALIPFLFFFFFFKCPSNTCTLGGGFVIPASSAYFRLFRNLVKDAERKGKSLAVFCLAYSLAPGATYPTQLRQSVDALRFVRVGNGRRSPQNILVGGDSAGGNLLLAVLAHLAQPHPEIPPLDLGPGPDGELGGAICLSPWVLLESEYNEPIDSDGDLIGEGVARVWAPAYLGGRERDAYTDPLLTPGEWLSRFPVRNLLVLAGSHEVLYPLLRQYGKRLQEFQPPDSKFELVVAEGECHVAPIYHCYLGEKTETVQGAKWRAWVDERIS